MEDRLDAATAGYKLLRRGHFFAAASAKKRSYFPAQKACFPKAASESPAVHPTNDKTRRFVPSGKAPFELMSAGRDHSADCLVMAQLILTRLSAITPRPTQRCIPASPL